LDIERTVTILSVPVPVFGVLQRLLTGVAPAAANLLGMDRLVGAVDTDWQTAELTDRLGVRDLRTVEQVLREKAGLLPTWRATV